MAVSKREKTKYFVFQVFEYVEIEGLYAATGEREVECFPDELLAELEKVPLVRVVDGKAALCVEMVVISALTHEIVHCKKLIPQTRNSFNPEYEISPRYVINGAHPYKGKIKKQAYLFFMVSQCLGVRGYYTKASMVKFHCSKKGLAEVIERAKFRCLYNPLEVWVECYTINSKGDIVEVHTKNVDGIFEKIKESRMKQRYIALRIWRSKQDKRDYPETEIMRFECLPEEVLEKLKPPADKRKDFERGSHEELILIGPGHEIEQFRN